MQVDLARGQWKLTPVLLTTQVEHYIAALKDGVFRAIWVDMRVPMRVHVPGVVPQPEAINYPTSDIDRAPTLLDLLGISTGADLQQGCSLFSPGIENYSLFLAMNLFAAFRHYDLDSYYSLGPQGRCTRVEPSTLLTRALFDLTAKRHKMPAQCLPNKTQANESS